MVKLMFAFLSAALLLSLPSFGAAADTQWRRYYFDGGEFREGADREGIAVYVREGSLPVIQKGKDAPRNDALPEGTGALVVFCFIEVAGGKLKSHSGSAPVAGAVVEIAKDGRKMAVRSDSEGFAALALPAGEYRVRAGAAVKKARIEKGGTALVSIRAGKRMVD